MIKRSSMRSINGDLTNWDLVDIIEQDSSTIFTYEHKDQKERHGVQSLHKNQSQVDMPKMFKGIPEELWGLA